MDWTGRVDGYDEDVLRVHQVVKVKTLKELLEDDSKDRKVCFVSFNSDEGIRRNNGRTGASEGWKHLKAALSNYPVFDNTLKLYDLKESIDVISGNLEAAQEKLADTVAELKKRNYFVVCLGGGHDIAYGTHNGILKYAKSKEKNPKIGIINFDAHFDMRDYKEKGANSGSMFLQIAEDREKDGLRFDYNVIGIQKFSNTKRLFDTAKRFGVNYFLARDIEKVNELNINPILNRNDYIHLSICTDVFHVTTAPGVSAPQSFGIWPSQANRLLNIIAQTDKDLTLEVAEISPRYDYDDRTSRLVANFIYQIILRYFKVEI
ncbi:MAG: formimidoylglutamase [Fusobacterium sp.]|uniref:formimidoylglutamase n=1 Tax=Fusobacterium sp. TaxID=68766 RepID=UPI0026DC6C67|nr:formimidoylglutamase [Fusobacterium sp.]MDO4689750.1 formimidoylglutamase [Fusobacterium sp.]